MNFLYYIITFSIVLFLFISFDIFLILYNKRLEKFEEKIIILFEKRSDLIPSLFEITRLYLNRHSEVFYEVIRLRKIQFGNYNENFFRKINNETAIHHELNFIFKVANKHPKIQKDEKFLLVRDLFLENSMEIGKKIKMYKKFSKTLNRLLFFKNITIMGIFIEIEKKEEI